VPGGSDKVALGSLELLVLLAILRLGDEAYGVPIARELDRFGGRLLSRASIHVTLQRLEEHGLVRSVLSAPRDDRGGRPRRYYRVLPAGVALVRRSKDLYTRLWKGLPALKTSTR
jgi:DNA-binding PadR family transcriptional regulator